MKLSGLSNQHKNLDGLLERFPESHERDCELYLVPTVGRLLRHLLTIDGPDLWVGSSMSLLNFVARDTTYDTDDVPPLAYAYTSGAIYRIEYPAPRELNVPGDAKIGFMDEDIERAGEHLLQAIEHSDANPNRITASWNWYVCPDCDYHHAHYLSNCIRCHYRFPSEVKCQVLGIFRQPEFPEGAVAPNHAVHRRTGAGL
ncbi:hypothetical protein [Planctomycetes bacterium TBK1r]